MLPAGDVFLNLCLTVLIFRNEIPVNASFLHFGTCFIDFAIWYLFYQLSSLYTSGIASKYQWHQYFSCFSVVCTRWFLESMFGGANFQKFNYYESYYFAFRHLLYPLSFIHTSNISFKYQRYQCFLLEFVSSADNGFLNHLSNDSVVIFRIRISVKAIFAF